MCANPREGVVDAPGVGENLQDHPEGVIMWEARQPMTTTSSHLGRRESPWSTRRRRHRTPRRAGDHKEAALRTTGSPVMRAAPPALLGAVTPSALAVVRSVRR